ncbi:glutathione S-transferase family protein [Pseudomonas sp. Marseille-P9899]|uniref:glutathione S-transferase family protein n=1 Tax=Pseudomonas sp. Marseille-P9899 TaxID=2730401 RepID=UPI00158E6909|nr:glutathione S-transferase family protein [Pseudomonas sp. Marseille-P9899]
MAIKLAIGDFNKSSWSLRAWLVLHAAGVEFDTQQVLLDQDDTHANILKLSPSGKVPALQVDDLVINDSLAIAEYIAEIHPQADLWPDDRELRALARAAAAEMHSGFVNLRTQMSFGLNTGDTSETLLDATREEIARIFQIWGDLRARSGHGTYLCGEHFGIVDAMYAPIVFRFRRFGIALPAPLQAYADAILAYPHVRTWLQLASTRP